MMRQRLAGSASSSQKMLSVEEVFRRSASASNPMAFSSRSAFRRWQINEAADGEDFSFLKQVHDLLKKVEDQWQQLAGQVVHVDAAGDSFQNLLNMMGLHATSVDFARRIGTYKTVLWNRAHLMIGGNFNTSDPIIRYFQEITSRG